MAATMARFAVLFVVLMVLLGGRRVESCYSTVQMVVCDCEEAVAIPETVMTMMAPTNKILKLDSICNTVDVTRALSPYL